MKLSDKNLKMSKAQREESQRRRERERERAMRRVQQTIVQKGQQSRVVRGGGEVRVMPMCVCVCETKSKRLSVQLPASLSNQWRNLCLYFPHATTRLSTPYPANYPPPFEHLPAALSNIYLHLSYNNSLMH